MSVWAGSYGLKVVTRFHMVQESTAVLLVLGIVPQFTFASNAKPSCLREVLKEVGDGSRADNLV